MKTTWQIIRCPHHVGARFALWLSGLRLGDTRDGRICATIDVEIFTDETFLVVAKWSKVDPAKIFVLDPLVGNCAFCGKPLKDHPRVHDSFHCDTTKGE